MVEETAFIISAKASTIFLLANNMEFNVAVTTVKKSEKLHYCQTTTSVVMCTPQSTKLETLHPKLSIGFQFAPILNFTVKINKK